MEVLYVIIRTVIPLYLVRVVMLLSRNYIGMKAGLSGNAAVPKLLWLSGNAAVPKLFMLLFLVDEFLFYSTTALEGHE